MTAGSFLSAIADDIYLFAFVADISWYNVFFVSLALPLLRLVQTNSFVRYCYDFNVQSCPKTY